jgi:hypothetical protein
MRLSRLTQLRQAFVKFAHVNRLAMWALFTASLTYAVRSAGLVLLSDENSVPQEVVEQDDTKDANGNWEGNASAWWNSATSGDNTAPAPVAEPDPEVPEVVEPTVVTSISQPATSSSDEDLRLVELFPRKSPHLLAINLSASPFVAHEGLPANISGSLSGTAGDVFLFESASTSGTSGAGLGLTAAPVPEPSTAILLAFGAFGLGFRRRR